MGSGVVRTRESNNANVSPGKKVRAMVEKKKAESPKPEMTKPVVVVCCGNTS